MDEMDRMDQQYSDNMSKLSTTMDRLMDSIADGFSLLRGLLLPSLTAYVLPSTASLPTAMAMFVPPSSAAANVYQPPSANVQ